MIYEIIDKFFEPIEDPGSRLYFYNILFTFFFAFVFYFFKKNIRISYSNFKRVFLNKKYWWNVSTKVDYSLFFLNNLLKVAIFIPYLNWTFEIAKELLYLLHDYLPLQTHPELSASKLAIFSIVFFIWDDFLRFIHHWLMHKIPFLWQFHQVHHSAMILTPLTLYRAHPVEVGLATLRNSLSLGVSTALFVYLFQAPMEMLTLLGVNILGIIFNFLGANLRHSHLPISFGIFEKVFISPKMHQIHHSKIREHYDKNFGVSLSIWDHLSGTVLYSHEVKKINWGLNLTKNKILP